MTNTIITPSLYKYLDFNGAEKTLGRCSVKLSAAAAFNDPFDMNIEEALGSNPDEFEEKLASAHFDFLCSDINHANLRADDYREKIIMMNMALHDASPEMIESLKKEVTAELAEELDPARLEQNCHAVVEKISNDLKTWGIFCASKRKDSLLMWAHYADHHRGAVFEFVPHVAKDSTFIAAQPVQYLRERPLLYRTPAEYIRHTHLMTLFDSTMEVINRIIYSKSPEWAYEEEYRLAIPDFIPAPEKFMTLRFHREELAAIHLGCRMPEEHKLRLIVPAKIINPDVKIYQTLLDKRDYVLHWQERDTDCDRHLLTVANQRWEKLHGTINAA
jgi:hypothetical protein